MSSPRTEPAADPLLEHAAWIRRLARSLVGEAAAEDLVQDTWVAALSSGPAMDRPLEPWLGTVLRNFARKRARSRANREARETSVAAPEELPGPEELCEHLESERLVTEELQRLAEPYRSTLLLRYYRDLQPIEIARRQGTPPGTVRWRIKRGLALLRERLDEKCGGDGTSWSLLLLPLARSDGLTASAAAGVGAPPIAFTGILVMNAVIKVGATLAVALLAYIGLIWMGVLPAPFTAEARDAQRVEVSFRPITLGDEPRDEGLAQADSEEHRQILTPRSTSLEGAASAALSTVGFVEAVIVDEAGRGLSGARLRELEGKSAARSVSSPGAGRVQLELDAGAEGRIVKVEAFRTGYASHVEAFRIEAGRTVHLGTIGLVPGGVISGTVVDEIGRGVSGAVVSHLDATTPSRELSIRRYIRSHHAEMASSLPRAVTDRRGEFTLVGLQAGYYRLWVQAPHMIPAFTVPMEVQVGQESYGVEIAMQAVKGKDHVHGVVLDPAGEPVPHARLRYTHSSAKGGLTIGDDEGIAAADGTFDFLLFDDARLWVSASDPEGRHGPASAEAVETGETPLVLQLTDLEPIDLLVLGSDGEPQERFAFELLSTDEELVHLESEGQDRPAGLASFFAPDGEFLVRVRAPLHRIETVGPFVPQSIAASIELRLQAVSGLVGQVLTGDEGAAACEVKLYARVTGDESITMNGFPCKFDPIPVDETTSDDEGRFLLTAPLEADYFVVAEKTGFAPAELGPLALEPDVNPAPVELYLGLGGAIEGRVIVETGADPAGTIVGIHRGDAHPRTLRIGPDGWYRFEGLTPGSWVVEMRSEEVFLEKRTIQTRPAFDGSFADEFDWSCEVYEGETTPYDLRLVDPEACRLAGSLRVDGRLPHAWVARILPQEANMLELRDGGTRLNPRGEFELGVPEPGRYQLVIKSTLEEQEEQFFLDEVSLSERPTSWEHELSTGSLVIEGLQPMAEGQDVPPLAYLWEGPGRLLYLCAIFPDPEDPTTCRLKAVPVGTGKLVRPNMQSMNPGDWEVALEVTISKGSEARVIAPRATH